MGDKYEVTYWDYHENKTVSVGFFRSFLKAKKKADELCKDWYCVSIIMRIKKY